MWLNSFKIAIIEKDTDRVTKLIALIPQFKTMQEKQEALYLLEEAKQLVYALKEQTATSMRQLEKNREFLKSTLAPQARKFDQKF